MTCVRSGPDAASVVGERSRLRRMGWHPDDTAGGGDSGHQSAGDESLPQRFGGVAVNYDNPVHTPAVALVATRALASAPAVATGPVAAAVTIAWMTRARPIARPAAAVVAIAVIALVSVVVEVHYWLSWLSASGAPAA